MQVESDWNSGNYQGAHSAAHTARNWGIAGVITGIIIIPILVLVIVAIIVGLGAAVTFATDWELAPTTNRSASLHNWILAVIQVFGCMLFKYVHV